MRYVKEIVMGVIVFSHVQDTQYLCNGAEYVNTFYHAIEHLFCLRNTFNASEGEFIPYIKRKISNIVFSLMFGISLMNAL